MKLTRQRVRDLNSLPGKSKGIRLPEPPKEAIVCKHRFEPIPWDIAGDSRCINCGEVRDWYGDPYS
jgi:hypothetical protein